MSTWIVDKKRCDTGRAQIHTNYGDFIMLKSNDAKAMLKIEINIRLVCNRRPREMAKTNAFKSSQCSSENISNLCQWGKIVQRHSVAEMLRHAKTNIAERWIGSIFIPQFFVVCVSISNMEKEEERLEIGSVVVELENDHMQSKPFILITSSRIDFVRFAIAILHSFSQLLAVVSFISFWFLSASAGARVYVREHL